MIKLLLRYWHLIRNAYELEMRSVLLSAAEERIAALREENLNLKLELERSKLALFVLGDEPKENAEAAAWKHGFEDWAGGLSISENPYLGHESDERDIELSQYWAKGWIERDRLFKQVGEVCNHLETAIRIKDVYRAALSAEKSLGSAPGGVSADSTKAVTTALPSSSIDSAWLDGYESAKHEFPVQANPYEVETDRSHHAVWLNGWQEWQQSLAWKRDSAWRQGYDAAGDVLASCRDNPFRDDAGDDELMLFFAWNEGFGYRLMIDDDIKHQNEAVSA